MTELSASKLVQQLAELDSQLFAVLQVELADFDDEALDTGLAQRATLLGQITEQGGVDEADVKIIIQRSQQLTQLAEAVKEQLGEQLQTIQKGRRSQQAYQNVKYQE